MLWPFPLLRNYCTSEFADKIFRDFISDPDVKLAKYGEYDIVLESPRFGELEFWNANKYYAWASRGRYTNKSGALFKWTNEMPSRTTVYLMRQKLTEIAFK